jgi:hypothetical protein
MRLKLWSLNLLINSVIIILNAKSDALLYSQHGENCSRAFYRELREYIQYCSIGYYSRWLRRAFRHVDFKVYNQTQYGMSLSTRDIVFIDHSANDMIFSKLEDVGRLVRQMML